MKKNILLLLPIVLMVAFAGCSQPKPVKTIENLKAGIKGETTASAKYLAFAEKARMEGYLPIAKLFEAASKSESIHAAIDGETYEVTTMYPGFLEAATTEKVDEAVKSFTWALETEKKHKEFYSKALDALNSMSLVNLPVGYVVCPVCGNTYDAAVVEPNCAFCGTAKEQFLTI